MKTLMVHIETEELIGHVSSLPEDEVVDFIKSIDSQAQSWSLTQSLCEYFLKEMRGYFATEGDFAAFAAFVDGVKGE